MSIVVLDLWLERNSHWFTLASLLVTILGIYIAMRKRINTLDERIRELKKNSDDQLDELRILSGNVYAIRENLASAIDALSKLQAHTSTLQQEVEEKVVPTLRRIQRLSVSAECWSFVTMILQGSIIVILFMLIVSVI